MELISFLLGCSPVCTNLINLGLTVITLSNLMVTMAGNGIILVEDVSYPR